MRVITVFVAVSFVILQLVEIPAPSLRLPDWTIGSVMVLFLTLFIITDVLYRNTGFLLLKGKAYFLLFGLLCFNVHNASGQDQKVADSLKIIYQQDNLEDSAELKLLSQLSFNEVNDLNLALKYAEELISLAKQKGNNLYLHSGYLQKGNKKRLFGDLEEALDAYFKSSEYAIKANYTKGEGLAYGTIADIYSISGQHQNAMHYYRKAISILRQSHDSIALASTILNAGEDFVYKKNYDSALLFYNESRSIFEKVNYPIGIAYSLGNIGIVNAHIGELNLAKKNIEDAIRVLEELEDYYPICVYLISLGDIYLEKGDESTALDYARRSLMLAQQYELKEQIRDASQKLAELYEKGGDTEESYKYYKNYIIYRDSFNNISTVKKMADLRTDYEVSQKQIEIDLLYQKRKNQRIINLAIAVTSLLIILLAIVIYRRYIFTKKTNIKIKTQRDEIESQRDILVSQKNEIIESINYAQRIQSALLPPEAYISELLNENFILYKPKDIVSGDFYWVKQINQFIVITAADCTGHGIPGAFMSMLGISYLNEIVQKREITQANQVLNELRKQIEYSLGQHGNFDESKDGIDMALCVMDLENMKMQYAGANSPLYLIQDVKGAPEINEIKADRMPLGYYEEEDRSFVNHEILLNRGDMFYIFSDGFIDQKGGKNNKKFMSKYFKNLLLKIHDQPMPFQKEILETTIADWMGDNFQMDDILVIGVRV